MALCVKKCAASGDMLYITEEEALNRCQVGLRKTGKVEPMKSFVLAVVAMAVIGTGAHYGLASLDLSAKNVYVTDNVRN